jgi:hypothetical protein
MATSPVAIVGMIGGATVAFRRLELPVRVARFELRCGQAAILGIGAFLLGAIAWHRRDDHHATPSRRCQASPGFTHGDHPVATASLW